MCGIGLLILLQVCVPPSGSRGLGIHHLSSAKSSGVLDFPEGPQRLVDSMPLSTRSTFSHLSVISSSLVNPEVPAAAQPDCKTKWDSSTCDLFSSQSTRLLKCLSSTPMIGRSLLKHLLIFISCLLAEGGSKYAERI